MSKSTRTYAINRNEVIFEKAECRGKHLQNLDVTVFSGRLQFDFKRAQFVPFYHSNYLEKNVKFEREIDTSTNSKKSKKKNKNEVMAEQIHEGILRF